MSLQVWEMYKKAESAFWTAEELDLAHDMKVRTLFKRRFKSAKRSR